MTSKKNQDEGAPAATQTEQLNAEGAARIIPATMTEANIQKKSVWRGLLKKLRAHQTLLLIAAGLLIILIVAGVAGKHYIDSKNLAADKRAAPIRNLGGDYADKSTAEVEQTVKQKTGKSVQDLQNQAITSKSFTSYSQAYAAAQVLNGVGDTKKSEQAYVVASDLAGNTASADFYLDYAAAAALNGDTQKTITLMKQAEAVINTDSSLTALQKQDQISKIDTKIDLISQGF